MREGRRRAPRLESAYLVRQPDEPRRVVDPRPRGPRPPAPSWRSPAFFTRAGEAVDLVDALELLKRAGAELVARDVVDGGFVVTTTWTAMRHPIRAEKPLIFATLVTWFGSAIAVLRASTESRAKIEHGRAIRLLELGDVAGLREVARRYK